MDPSPGPSTEPQNQAAPPDGTSVPSLADINQLKVAVFKRRPVFGEIMMKHGEKSLYDYARDFLDVNSHPVLDQRRAICFKIVQHELEKRLGKKIAEEVDVQLIHKPLVSTTDHHAIIDHPFWVNANIITALPYPEAQDPTLKYLVVLSFASVSLNNASGYPRGLLFHGGDHGEGPLIRLPILPDKWKMRMVAQTPSYTAEDLDRAVNQLRKKVQEGVIAPARAAAIEQLITEVFRNPDVLSSDDFSTQITKINFRLWPKFFSGTGIPQLIYLEAETVTTQIWLQEILHTDDCLLYQMLFDPTIRTLVQRYFNNLAGAFSIEQDWGTFFFWGFDDKGHRLRLMLEGDALVSKTKDISIPLTPDAIREALIKKTILPSMMAVYLTLALHYGLKCLGGFSQVNDLTRMKEALLHLLVERQNFKEVTAVSRIQTKELGGDGMAMAYLDHMQELAPATGIDLWLSQDKPSFTDYINMSRHVTLQEMIMPLLPEIYSVLYPAYQREDRFATLTPDRVLTMTGLDKKLRSLQDLLYHRITLEDYEKTQRRTHLRRKIART